MGVDIGATSTILSRRIVIRKKLEPAKRKVVLSVATGEQVTIYGECNVDIEITRRHLHRRALVDEQAPGSNLSSCKVVVIEDVRLPGLSETLVSINICRSERRHIEG